MQRCVALVVFNVNEGLLDLGKELNDLEVAKLTGQMKSGLTGLGSRVDLCKMFDKDLDYFKVMACHSDVKGGVVLIVLVVNIGTEVLVHLFV
jgi:hypothetical protein